MPSSKNGKNGDSNHRNMRKDFGITEDYEPPLYTEFEGPDKTTGGVIALLVGIICGIVITSMLFSLYNLLF